MCAVQRISHNWLRVIAHAGQFYTKKAGALRRLKVRWFRRAGPNLRELQHKLKLRRQFSDKPPEQVVFPCYVLLASDPTAFPAATQSGSISNTVVWVISRLMQSPRAALRAGDLNLLRDVRTALGSDLVCCFLDKSIAAKARDLGVDCVLDMSAAMWRSDPAARPCGALTAQHCARGPVPSPFRTAPASDASRLRRCRCDWAHANGCADRCAPALFCPAAREGAATARCSPIAPNHRCRPWRR